MKKVSRIERFFWEIIAFSGISAIAQQAYGSMNISPTSIVLTLLAIVVGTLGAARNTI